MKIYFVRHGKTEWNLARRLQGQKGDSPLLPEALTEIERVRDFLAPIKFDEILSSPQTRALTTAKLLTDCAIKRDQRLAEWNFGELEGWFIADAIAKYPKEMHDSRFELDKFDGRAFGAESVSSVLARFDDLGRELLHSEMDNVLLIGHGASGTAGMRHLSGFGLSELRAAGGLANNTVTILEGCKDHFELKVWDQKL
ncbi:histidine phosphatase family protein [Lactococcus kimchii]|uniref:histidine phosphatase family protein n=1 Tax=Lactococcus sp. S-13 TaxID=2507158 RepID=UPI001023276B|nr:histidine phosphatase family protein [Lactococcus sp. S-13]RZI48946.1 histidine phosphatase family protein [Lactococcus sp. S-13]